MRRRDLEHVVAAAAEVAGEEEIVVVGGQAILGSYPDAPAGMTQSREVDLYPRRSPEKSDDIEGSLGDGSHFHEAFQYYAHGVAPETVKAPKGWEDRLVEIPIPKRVASKVSATAYCLEPHDLVLAKVAAGRERDWDYAQKAIESGLVDYDELTKRVNDLPVDSEAKQQVRKMLEGIKQRNAQ